jgi:hypothetical protein
MLTSGLVLSFFPSIRGYAEVDEQLEFEPKGGLLRIKPIEGEETFPIKIDTPLDDFKSQMTPQQKKSLLDERSLMVSQMLDDHKKLTELSEKQKKLEDNLKSYRYDEQIDEEIKKMNGSKELLGILADKNALINTLSSDDAQRYAALSALAYEEYTEGRLKRSKLSTQTDLEITKNTKLLESLKSYESNLSDLFKLKDPQKIASQIKKFKAGLKDIFGVDVGESNQYDVINEAISKKINNLSDQIEKLKEDALLAQSDDMIKLQKVLKQNRFAKDLEVKGIFYRNDGEFSGFAAYDTNNHRLHLVFAGSKSRGDWIKNLFGWNAKASARRGLLTNMNIHAGFLSHLENLSDESFEMAYKMIKTLSDQKPDKPLEISGTGHSLGGALATLFTAAAKQMAESMGVHVKASGVTFGAPNLVHGGSVDTLNKLFGGAGNWVRFEHSKDPVPLAVFWKDNPGVSIRYNGSIFWDTANAMQIFGQNPHGSDNYYHSVKTHAELWQQSVQQLRSIVQAKEEKLSEIRNIKSEANKVSSSLNKKMIAVVNFDVEHASHLAKEKSSYINRLTKEIEEYESSLKKAFSQAESLEKQFEEGGLSESMIAPLSSQLEELHAKMERARFLMEDVEKNKVWQQLTKEKVKSKFDRINELKKNRGRT